jgi:hypothetical protein
MKRPFNMTAKIRNGDLINTTMAAISIITMVIVNTLVHVGRSSIWIVGIS